MENRTNVILGAGLAGISAAYHLTKGYEIFEKESSIGGLCRSVTKDGFTFDYGPHILFPEDIYSRQLIKSLLKNNLRAQNVRLLFVLTAGLNA